MQLNQHILVIINPDKDGQVALDKAIRLSHRLGSKITALVRRKHAVPKLLATLEQKLAVASVASIEIAIEISDETNLFRAIMRTLHHGQFDLLLKEAHKSSIKDHIFLPDDWKLLRNSAIAVLLVHDDNEWHNSDILLCVDANPKDPEHQQLNEQILAAGRFIKQVGNAQINLATAFPPDMQSSGSKTLTLDFRQQQYRQACRELITPDDQINDSQIHVGQGPAELFITQLASELDVKLVILGTVARSGLKSILLGNTSEQIINRLTTDVLVLPPR